MTESLHIVCPHCHTTNRVRRDHFGSEPTCGSCQRAVFAGRSVSFARAGDEQWFERHLARTQLPVVVDFWAPWCAPCRSMAPAFEQAAAELPTSAQLLKVDTEALPELGARFAIRSIPTMVLFEGGRETARQAGAMGAADIVRWVRARRTTPAV